jgi:putative transposase
LWLSKIGHVEIRLHRCVSSIKQITILKRINKWYALICCEIAKPIYRFINPKKSVGIDVGITKFLHDSDDNIIDNPLFLKKMLKPLRRAHRRLSRRHKYSKNRFMAKTRLQILHERIRNKRLDFLHKISIDYARRYDMIFLERLKVLNMVKNHRLARSILDGGWATFKNILQYKAKSVIEVPSTNTSVDCSRCGNRVPKSLAVRIHRCDRCGSVIDRDYNASLNIKRKGLQLLKLQKLLMGHEEVTPVEILGESVKQEKAMELSIASPHLQ